jgi:hypothetical protein
MLFAVLNGSPVHEARARFLNPHHPIDCMLTDDRAFIESRTGSGHKFVSSRTDPAMKTLIKCGDLDEGNPSFIKNNQRIIKMLRSFGSGRSGYCMKFDLSEEKDQMTEEEFVKKLKYRMDENEPALLRGVLNRFGLTSKWDISYLQKVSTR